jgi:hypothetical protein
MIRKTSVVVFTGLVLASATSAQTPARLRWQTGQALTYQASHATQALEVVEDKKVETKSLLNLTKRWQVVGVDAAGVATLQLTLLALRMEMTTHTGDVLKFDSAAPKDSTPELREQLRKFVGPPLAVLRVDGTGKVLEVKESKFGPASRYESELPFVGVLPVEALRQGLQWERAFQITLEPPQGTGEKHAAIQKYVCKSVAGYAATVGVMTELKAPPPAVADRIPLQHYLPEGEIVYDLQAGRMKSAVLKIDKELKGHQGEGSSYHFQSQYTEQFVGDR